jgi:hypothetical protein
MSNIQHSQEEALNIITLPFELAELQSKDIDEAAIHGRYLFAYEVGVGKTVVATVVATMWNSDHTVIVVPPILNDQWAYWLKSVGHSDISIYEGPKRTLDMLNHRWVIMSHNIFRNDYLKIHKVFTGKDVAVIVDEAQWLKSAKSKLYRYVNQFIGPDRKILLLTGTPTSKPHDTYTYMKIKTPMIYRSFAHWEQLHVAERDIFKAITKYKNIDILKRNFKLQASQRTKEEVFGFNLDPIFQPIRYRLSSKHQKLYEKLAEEQLLLLPDGGKVDATTSQRLRNALQQIVVNFSSYSGDPKDVSTAFDLIENTLDEVDPLNKRKSKLTIWTNYKSTTAAVTAYLQNKYGNRAVVAAYSDADSKASIKAILGDEECRILVVHPRSGGVGLDGLQKVCWENLLLETPTSPIEVRQLIGRTSRTGAVHKATFRIAQAIGTLQTGMFESLLANDALASEIEWDKKSLRDEILGC